MSNGTKSSDSHRQYFGLVLGLTVFVVLAVVPLEGIPRTVRHMMAVTAIMAIWWMTEAIPLAATSLLPLVLLPILGIASAPQAAAPYANHLVFLFLGGFMLAQAMQRWNLHRRLALMIVQIIGTSPSQVVLGFMCASAFLSMWVSNTATTAMMMPIALAVIQQARETIQCDTAHEQIGNSDDKTEPFHFGTALMLGVAYGASIGGVGTIIGTPPNVFFAGMMQELYGIKIDFVSWLIFGVPFVVFFLPLVWLWLTRIAFPLQTQSIPDSTALIQNELGKLGTMGTPEKRVATLFALTAAAWIFRPLWINSIPNGSLVTDSTIAMATTVLLFALPAGNGERILDWKWASRLPWDVLLLFGGGFSLANGFQVSGLSLWVGEKLSALAFLPLPVFIIIIVLAIICLTEFASNLASTAMSLPILAATASNIGVSALVLCIPATIASSCAFMLPAATPPNAIVFGTGYVSIKQMVKAGIGVNILGVIITSLFALLLIRPVFGV